MLGKLFGILAGAAMLYGTLRGPGEAVSTAVVHIYGADAAFFIAVDKFASGAGFYAKTAFFKAKALGGVYTKLLFGRNGFRV